MTTNITKDNAPTVSVIIPVYNGISTLPKCLESLKNQDYPRPFEVILVDDGSTDGSGDYAENQGVKVLRQQNKGPGIARNTGAEIASGELLVFTDADCVLNHDFITEMVKPLRNPEIVGSQGMYYSRQKNIIARFIQLENSERYDRKTQAEYIDWLATFAACYRRDVFLENGGFSDNYSSEDIEFSFRLANKGYKMVLAPKAMCEHLHYESFFKFIRFKYKRAYWTIWLYRQYPNRLIKDPLTPKSRKSMMLFMVLVVLSFILGIWWKWALYVALVSAGILILSTLPLSFRILKKDLIVGLMTPLFLLTRTASYICGFTKGLFDYFRGVKTVRKSASK